MNRLGGQPKISPVTLNRRSFLDWFGKTTVLGLGAGLLARCESMAPARSDGGPIDGATNGSSDGAPVDVDSDSRPEPVTPLCENPSEPMTFSPSPASTIFPANRERTVDRQDLEAILASWRLTVDGLVRRPLNMSFSDLFCLPRQDQVTDFHCVEGWSILDVPWNGVHLSGLLEVAGPLHNASHVTFHTLGGTYNESLPLEVALEPRTLLAFGAGGSTLPLAHGFPLRLVVPRLLAYKSAKYVHRIELTDRAVEGFWVQHGYPYEALVPEARLRPGKY